MYIHMYVRIYVYLCMCYVFYCDMVYCIIILPLITINKHFPCLLNPYGLKEDVLMPFHAHSTHNTGSFIVAAVGADVCRRRPQIAVVVVIAVVVCRRHNVSYEYLIRFLQHKQRRRKKIQSIRFGF